MAYDHVLAERVRVELGRHAEFAERKMFGGLAFLVKGNMCCGITATDLMLRLTPEAVERALKAPHARPMDFTGKPMRSMVYVSADGVSSDAALRQWVEAAADVALRLPAKAPRTAPARKPARAQMKGR